MTIAVDQSLNEKLMYVLYDCNIASIQKSAFILLVIEQNFPFYLIF